MQENDNEKIKSALFKKATGFDTEEVVIEYITDNDGERVLKRKVTKKNVPPDITAIKMLLDDKNTSFSSMTDEELIKERDRLIKLLTK